jgi:malate synthase
VDRSGLQVAEELDRLVAEQALPGTGVELEAFWRGFAELLADLVPKNRALLEKRDELQSQIDDWHVARKGQPLDAAAYKAFLQDIGYLVPEPKPFTITTSNVDEEIAVLAGPQLVVPVMNARFALNAANARWGSLYDAFYGTDIFPEDPGREKGRSYNPARGELVAFASSGRCSRTVATRRLPIRTSLSGM